MSTFVFPPVQPVAFVFPAAPPAEPVDDGHPFGSPIDGGHVLAYLAEPQPADASFGGGSILAALAPNAPQSRRDTFLKALREGSALDGAAGTVGLTVDEVNAAMESPGLAREVQIARAVGIKANLDAGSASMRHRYVTTGEIDRADKVGDAGTEYQEMKAKLASLIASEEGLTSDGVDELLSGSWVGGDFIRQTIA